LNDKPSLQELLEVQAYFGLPSPALVEKDWYVVKALAAITAIDASPFQLVFGGGTALGRAHRLIHRMSEDIDLKIISAGAITRPTLRQLRNKTTDALLGAGFEFDPEKSEHRESGNASRYTIFRLPYTPIIAGDGALRPEIQIELAAWPLRQNPVEKAVSSFIADAFKKPPEVQKIKCVSIVETAAEKFVALTRRAGTEQTGSDDARDPTIVRHIYDLHVIREHYNPIELIALAQDIMKADAKAYGHLFPAYRENPMDETFRAIEALESDTYYAQKYATFYRDMVYGEISADFAACMKTIKELSIILRSS
jgi:hypothetical protein